MRRLIDAISLSEGIELHRQSTDQEYETGRQWAVGYNAGLDRALYSIAYAKTITPPPNDPLTQEELREMGNDWVWIKLLVPLYRMESGYYIQHKRFSGKDRFCCGYPDIVVGELLYASYGSDWLAFRRKPEDAP